ncbi:MAG: TRAP transporter small permease [Alphaproteobacteria bacterium]
MAEASLEQYTRPTDPVGRVLFQISRAFAIFGGFVLCAMAVLTTVSVTGRSTISLPVTGDFELIAIGTGVAVFAFLPYCQLVRENVIVDIFMSRASFKARTICDLVGNFLYVVIIMLMLWRLPLGGMELYENDQMTLVLEVPQWWTFPLAILCLILLLVVNIYTVVRSYREIRMNRTL